MGEENVWKTLAIEKQMQFFETLGSRPYDEIEKTNLFLLKKKVGFATCGKPSELPVSSNLFTGYNEEELKHIKSICEKIVEKSDCDPIRFACTILILYHKDAICETSVFRIQSETGNIFIDAHGRVYQDWNKFMGKNKLPDCEYCYPFDGIYKYDAKGEARIGFACSPSSSLFNKATDCLDTAGTVVSVAAAAVFAVSTFAAVAPVVLAAAGTSAAYTGVYSITRGATTLYDRKKHEQPVGLKDPESRSAWMSIGSSAAGVATVGALGKAKKVVESGKSLSKLSVFGLHALTTSSLVFSGFGFVDTLFVCVDKYNKGVLTKKDVFDLSCELLFLFNAIASAKATTNLVNNMTATAAAEPSVQKKLTKTQKRNLRKRAAKRRAKGLPINSDSEPATVSEYSAVTVLLLEAVIAYAPRVEEVLYNCQSIFHDIKCWKNNELPLVSFMKNIFRSIFRLYNDFKDDISSAMEKLAAYFTSLNLSKVVEDLFDLFYNASEEFKAIFCIKVTNMEDQVESLINDTEREVTDLYEQLGIAVENTAENVSESSEESDEDGWNPESQRLLTTCGNVITASGLSCKDLQEFGEILDGVKAVFVSEFKLKVSYYKKNLEAAKTGCGDSFDVSSYHEVLGITGDVGQHMFNETLQNLLAKHVIYQIKCKCKEIQMKRSGTQATPIWEGLYEGVFHYYGPDGSGALSESALLYIVDGIVSEVDVTKTKYKLMEENDVLMIEVPLEDGKEIHVVVYRDINEENTACGIIIVAKLN